ncbi:ly6/PLAUR domain-containing protein 1 [Lepisosteus oculatus]|uniref:LY6/PLAUR domain containing 1 n=1 Tax=Lepisosteus oculatus TaxID=7918 RepID=W5M4X6_LEPOC|nr:PREDICTED: ly6/PLAUR domain-containing protein 1 [Lepisosteus oculatus]
MRLFVYTTLLGFLLSTGIALQIQCYQCEEFQPNDCSTPEFIVNCTVNVQDMCQKEVLVRSDEYNLRMTRMVQLGMRNNWRQSEVLECQYVILENILDGIHYRKSCASSAACLIASSGYQQFCTGKLNSVCISCCNTPLCNGPRQKKRPNSSVAPAHQLHVSPILLSCLLTVLLS